MNSVRKCLAWMIKKIILKKKKKIKTLSLEFIIFIWRFGDSEVSFSCCLLQLLVSTNANFPIYHEPHCSFSNSGLSGGGKKNSFKISWERPYFKLYFKPTVHMQNPQLFGMSVISLPTSLNQTVEPPALYTREAWVMGKNKMSCQNSGALHPYASIIFPRPLYHHTPHQEQQWGCLWVIKPLIALHGWIVFITALQKTWDSQILYKRLDISACLSLLF